jgi:formiminotetrahydrofolate cyclodeaminase
MSPAFLEALAQARPDPGGGAAAAYGARLGLALLEKVIKLELRRPNQDKSRVKFWQDHLRQVRRGGAALSRLQEADVKAYKNLARARAVGAQGRELAAALQEATRVPLRIMEQAQEALGLVSATGAHAKRHLLADLLVAAELLLAALRGAYHIAGANLPLITQVTPRRDLEQKLSRIKGQGLESFKKVSEELAILGRGTPP